MIHYAVTWFKYYKNAANISYFNLHGSKFARGLVMTSWAGLGENPISAIPYSGYPGWPRPMIEAIISKLTGNPCSMRHSKNTISCRVSRECIGDYRKCCLIGPMCYGVMSVILMLSYLSWPWCFALGLRAVRETVYEINSERKGFQTI